MSLYTNDIVSFKYDGGSTPGAVRTVYVEKNSGGTLYCWDFEREAYRHFKEDKISEIKFVDFRAVELAQIPESAIPAVQKGFEEDGYKVYQTKNELLAVKLPPKKKQFTLSICDTDDYRYIRNADMFFYGVSEAVGLYLSKDGKIILHVGVNKTENPTIEQLIDALSTLKDG